MRCEISTGSHMPSSARKGWKAAARQSTVNIKYFFI